MTTYSTVQSLACMGSGKQRKKILIQEYRFQNQKLNDALLGYLTTLFQFLKLYDIAR